MLVSHKKGRKNVLFASKRSVCSHPLLVSDPFDPLSKSFPEIFVLPIFALFVLSQMVFFQTTHESWGFCFLVCLRFYFTSLSKSSLYFYFQWAHFTFPISNWKLRQALRSLEVNKPPGPDVIPSVFMNVPLGWPFSYIIFFPFCLSTFLILWKHTDIFPYSQRRRPLWPKQPPSDFPNLLFLFFGACLTHECSGRGMSHSHYGT